MNNMDKLIILLIAFYGTRKNIHYNTAGKWFFAWHEMVDNDLDELNDLIDGLFEHYYLPKGQPSPDYRVLYEQAARMVGRSFDEAKKLAELIFKACSLLKEEHYEPIQAEVDSVSQAVGKQLGFIRRTTEGEGM